MNIVYVTENYRTCGRCKWSETPENSYPCNNCIHGPDTREDLWELDDDSQEVEE